MVSETEFIFNAQSFHTGDIYILCDHFAILYLTYGSVLANRLLYLVEDQPTIVVHRQEIRFNKLDMLMIFPESELLIFLADSNKPYFKPKVNITKDILPRFV